MRGFISLGDTSPRLYRRKRGYSRLAFWRRSIGYDNGTYLVLTTDYGKRLCSGRGYIYRKSLRVRLVHSAIWALRLAVLLALSLAVPAQAHGSNVAAMGSLIFK